MNFKTQSYLYLFNNIYSAFSKVKCPFYPHNSNNVNYTMFVNLFAPKYFLY